MLNHEEEIEALKYARGEVSRGSMYVCNLVKDWAASYTGYAREAFNLVEEVSEFLDGSYTLERWLFSEHVEVKEGNAYLEFWINCNEEQTEVAKKYRLAIIDTLLARRGVK